jgi:Flp pilus assembly protein TadG
MDEIGWTPGVPMERDQRRGRRARGDDGAALVEAAIVLPFIVLMVFGIVELGFLFRSAAVTNSATRSGARLAAAQYGSATNSTERATILLNVRQTVEKDLLSKSTVDTPQQLWIYKANSAGDPPTGNYSTCGAPCIVYTWDSSSNTFGTPSGTWDTADACGLTHDNVGVYLRVSHAPIGFANFLGTLTLNEHTVMRLESPLADTNDCSAQS